MNEKGKSTLDKYVNYLKVKNYSGNTIKSYVYYTNEFIMSFSKSSLHITIADARDYIYNYEYSSTSNQNQVYSSLKIFCKEILKFNLSKIFPERPRKEKKLPKIIDETEIRKGIESINNLKHRAMLQLMFATGMRRSEIINLKIDAIDGKRERIHISNAKGRKDRIVKVSINTLELLREYYKKYKPTEYLFNGQSAAKYSTTSLYKICKKYLGCNPHLLRHSCGTAMVENGTDISVVQKSFGHNSINTTRIYVHLSKKMLDTAYSPM